MNLKKIELYGFKAFVDKTEIKFEEGITAIVGPNGCGKSNFADAVRWVMGEQRTKLLRVENTSGIIFSGTELRKSLSFCEVSLFFDNSSRILPIDFEEVVLTRKAFRSGNSEFYINNSLCRLRDIQELLRDTGMGREGYSIIGQGQTTTIVSSKPKDRRAIFEEAAGIATFKSRKDTAEKRLDSTLENIKTIEAVTNEIEKQLTPLKKQAEDAKAARDLLEKLKSNEVNLYIYQTENANQIKSSTINKINGYQDEINKSNSEIESLTTLHNVKTNEASVNENKISELTREKTDYLLKEVEIRGKSGIKSERLSNLNANKERREHQFKEDTDLIQKLKALLFDSVKSQNEKKEQHNILINERDFLIKEYETISKTVSEMEETLETSRDSIFTALGLLSEIKTNKGKFQKEKEMLEEKALEISASITNGQNELETKEKEKTVFENSYQESLKHKANLEKINTNAANELAKSQFEIENLKGVIKELSTTVASLEVKKNIIERYREDYEGFQAAVQKLMNQAKTNRRIQDLIEGVVVELVNVPKDYEIAISTALGNSMQNIVTRNADDAREIVDFLKVNKIGQVTLLPITSYKKRDLDKEYLDVLNAFGVIGIAKNLVEYDKRYENIFSGLLGSTIICDNIANAIRVAKEFRYSFKIVTIDGDVINPSGAITGGFKRNDNASIINQDREIEETKKLLSLKTKELQKREKELQDLVENNEILDGEYKKSKVLIDEKNILLTKDEAVINNMQDAINRIVSELQLYHQSFESNKNRLKLITDGLLQAEKEDAHIEGQKSSESSEIKKAREEFIKCQNQKELISQDLTNKKLEVLAVEKELANLSNEIKNLSHDRDACLDRLNENQAEIKSLTFSIKETEKEIEEAVITKEDREKFEKIKAEIENCIEKKNALQNEISQIATSKEQLWTRLSDLNGKKVREEEHLKAIENDMSELAERILEEYNLTYRDAVAFKVENFDYKNALSEITSIRRSLNRLGPINYCAIEQFDQLNNRYQTYTSQLTDLKDAEVDLREIITELSKAMLDKFNEEFVKINQNFSQVFKDLFGGGRASLSILPTEEGEDELSAGIDIFAEPPGKKMQTMAALSGGEQTLTAIAILFSILKVKAVPFCVLDEIEAALDDSNTRLFSNYLKRLSKETQFIVITHKKPTMELSDRLFGVTMQEPGVSKVVKVTLSEAVKHIQEEK